MERLLRHSLLNVFETLRLTHRVKTRNRAFNNLNLHLIYYEKISLSSIFAYARFGRFDAIADGGASGR